MTASNTNDREIDVLLPKMGMQTTEADILEWMVAVGDLVQVDSPLCEVSTDKVEVVIPSPAAGRIVHIAAEVEDTVEVGGLLCRIDVWQDGLE